MTAHFIQYIDIDRYKCFSDFSAHGFQRVNLIAGKHNVGKTALMEAMFINVRGTNVNNLFDSLFFIYTSRRKTYYSFKTPNKIDTSENTLKSADSLKTKTNIQCIDFKTNHFDHARRFEININNFNTNILEKDIDIFSIRKQASKKKIVWISSSRDPQEDIIESFFTIQVKDQEDNLNRFINDFDNEIEKVKIIGDSIQCRVTASDGTFYYRDISEYGDGLRLFISVISDMLVAENNYIFIDEIDNGVHYTSLDKLWDIILTLSKELNVQVFATTHSRECIESYCRMVEKHQARDISFITLVKNKEKQIKAIVRDYDTFTDSIHDSREVRGW